MAIILTLDALPLAGRDPVLVGRLEPFGGVLAAIKAAMQLMGEVEQLAGAGVHGQCGANNGEISRPSAIAMVVKPLGVTTHCDTLRSFSLPRLTIACR